MKFIDNAARLEEFTIVHTNKFPKKYTFKLTNRIVQLSVDVYDYVSSANEYPHTLEMYKRREELFENAKESLRKLVRQLRVAFDLFKINPNVIKDWMCLIEKEERLINGVIISDREMVQLLYYQKAKEAGDEEEVRRILTGSNL